MRNAGSVEGGGTLELNPRLASLAAGEEHLRVHEDAVGFHHPCRLLPVQAVHDAFGLARKTGAGEEAGDLGQALRGAIDLLNQHA